MTIEKNLLEEQNIKLYKSYSAAYDKAKNNQGIRFFFSYALAIVPLLLIAYSEYKPIVSIVGSLWGLIAFFLTIWEKNKIKIAAKIQDEFDCNIFNIQSNNILVGSVSAWDIDQLSKSYSKPVDLSTWYGKVKHIPSPLSVIICQRTNVIWDWRLRKQYYFLLLVFLILLFLAGVLLATYNKMLFSDYITQLLLPASSAFILGIKELLEHFENYTSKQKLETKIDSIISNHKSKNQNISAENLRQIQDLIFILRKCSALVPSWFYKLFQKVYDQRMQIEINKAY